MPRSPFAFTAVLALAATAALAETPAPITGDEIRALVSDNTVEGSMFSSGRYTEFYAADGTIRGEGYTGAWTVEADAMCFDYGEGPDCWQVGGSAEELFWIQNGEVGGTGAVVAGNPNDF
ncbi:MAG: hypothetical protein ACFBRM_14490 [Pikeienuella sp.]